MSSLRFVICNLMDSKRSTGMLNNGVNTFFFQVTTVEKNDVTNFCSSNQTTLLQFLIKKLYFQVGNA